MRLSAQDEYGLRLLLRIARADAGTGLTTAELSEVEGISMSHAGKVVRLLRLGGYVDSRRGNRGGYVLTRAPEAINVGEVLAVLGGRLFDQSFCADHSEGERLCTNSVDCSVRSLWRMVQASVDRMLTDVVLADLLGDEETSRLTLVGKLPSRRDEAAGPVDTAAA